MIWVYYPNILFPCKERPLSYHIETIPNRNSPPAILLRKAWREGKRIRKLTLANLTHLPPDLVEGIRRVLKGGVVLTSPHEAFVVQRSLPHGHVAAVLGLCRQLGLPRLLGRTASRTRELALAGLIARVLAPASKLATARQLSPDTAASSLGAVLGLGEVSGNELLNMLDWLLKRQPWIERSLARRYLKDGTVVLYDMTSSDLEGRCCPLAKFGHNRDGKRGKQQIAIGLLCTGQGCPIAVEVFAGNTADPSTVPAQVARLKERFNVERIALVGDRGMLTTARIRETVAPAGLDWISALKSADLRTLLKPLDDGRRAPLQPEGLQPDAVAEIFSPDFPGERLVVCLNPRLREERARKREDLLQATEAILRRIAGIVRRKGSRLRGRDRINRRVGREANRRKVEKHFDIVVKDDDLTFQRNTEKNRGRSPPRRHLHRAHQPRCQRPRCPPGGESLQIAVPRGTRVPISENRPTPGQTRVRVQRRARSRPRVPVHPGLPRGVAPATAPGADAVRRPRPRRRPRPALIARATGPNVRTGTAQMRHRDHRRGPDRAQSADPAG